MAKAAREKLGRSITTGVVITKYGHVEGDIPDIDCMEAGHPLPDDNTIAATTKALEMIGTIKPDNILFLVSGAVRHSSKSQWRESLWRPGCYKQPLIEVGSEHRRDQHY
jgi:hypothetical protein